MFIPFLHFPHTDGPPYQQLPTAPLSPKRSVKWAGEQTHPDMAATSAKMAPRSPEQIKMKLHSSNDPSLHDRPYTGKCAL